MQSRKRERCNDDGEEIQASVDTTKKPKPSVVVEIDNKPVSMDAFKEIVKTAVEEDMANFATRIEEIVSATLEKSMASFATRLEEVISSTFERSMAEFSSNVKEIVRSNVEEATADYVITIEDLNTNLQLLRNRVQELEGQRREPEAGTGSR